MNNKKLIIYLYGGPGSGKSTVAAQFFALAKQNGINIELVREYIKNWVWEERKRRVGDQVYVLAKQARAEQICFPHVDMIVSDSPVYNSPIYEQLYDKPPFVCLPIIDKFTADARRHGFEYLHVYIERCKPYHQAGRYESEEKARYIDGYIKDFLKSVRLDYHTVLGDENAANEIMKIVNNN